MYLSPLELFFAACILTGKHSGSSHNSSFIKGASQSTVASEIRRQCKCYRIEDSDSDEEWLEGSDREESYVKTKEGTYTYKFWSYVNVRHGFINI